MIKKFKIFEQKDSKVGLTFKLIDVIRRNNNWDDFIEDLNKLILDRRIEIKYKSKIIYMKVYKIESLEVNYNSIANNTYCAVLEGRRISLDGKDLTGDTRNNYYVLSSDLIITIIKDPKIIISKEDPYGEEDWN